jgi:hypothetical protein
LSLIFSAAKLLIKSMAYLICSQTFLLVFIGCDNQYIEHRRTMQRYSQSARLTIPFRIEDGTMEHSRMVGVSFFSWGGFHKAIYPLHLEFALYTHPILL